MADWACRFLNFGCNTQPAPKPAENSTEGLENPMKLPERTDSLLDAVQINSLGFNRRQQQMKELGL